MPFSVRVVIVNVRCIEQIVKLFEKIDNSEAGSNNRMKEEDTFSLFVDECEKCKCHNNCKKIQSLKKSVYYRFFLNCGRYGASEECR